MVEQQSSMSDVYNEYAIDLLQKFIETRNELTLQRVLNECFQHVVAVPPELALNVSIQLITVKYYSDCNVVICFMNFVRTVQTKCVL